MGVARTVHDGVIHSDYTMLTVAHDPQNMRFYYNTYNDETLRMVDLSRFDPEAEEIKRISTKSDQPIADMSEEFE